jgi:mRNA interferase MazF
MDGLVEIQTDDWLRGGTPDDSRIIPWGVQSISHEDIDFWQGRLSDIVVSEAVASLVADLESAMNDPGS